MPSERIKGRIIRILDTKTLVINLGRENGIENNSFFYILGEPEPVSDPVTNEVLGTVNVTKAKVKASQVFDKFTIATSSWTNVSVTAYGSVLSDLMGGMKTERVNEDLTVATSDIKPWKAKSASPVKVGDEVEVSIEVSDPEEDAIAAGVESEDEDP